jgi:hypothetical protein
MPYITLLTGLGLSGVAAFYSIVGLTTLFAGEWWAIVIMGSTLEVAKLVSVSWLYRNWDYAHTAVKAYLSAAIAILMFITSMGIYGFLAKAHIDQQLKLDVGVSTQLPIIENKITTRNDVIKDLDKQIAVIDDAINKMITTGKSDVALKKNEEQTKKRDELLARKEKEANALAEIKAEKIRIESEVKKMEAEVGPIKYIAEIFYDTSDTKLLDKAVRGVIMIIIIVFDPLAIFLMIAFNISMKRKEETTIDYFEIPKSMRDPKQLKEKRIKGRTKRTNDF